MSKIQETYFLANCHSNNDTRKCSLFSLDLFTDTFLSADPPGEQVFRAMFRVVRGDAFSAELADPATEQFRIRARDYRERLNLVFRRSDLRPAFLGTEVLALDGSVPLGLNKVTEVEMCVDFSKSFLG